MDGVFCGGVGVIFMGVFFVVVKVVIFMGDLMYNQGLLYNVGICRVRGVCIVFCICWYVGGVDENCVIVCWLI